MTVMLAHLKLLEKYLVCFQHSTLSGTAKEPCFLMFSWLPFYRTFSKVSHIIDQVGGSKCCGFKDNDYHSTNVQRLAHSTPR